MITNGEADELKKYIACPQALAIRDDDGDTPINRVIRDAASDDLLRFYIDLAHYYANLKSTSYSNSNSNSNSNDDNDGDETVSDALLVTDYSNDSLLHTAVSHFASPSTVRHLLERQPRLLTMVNAALQTPLHVAIENERYDLASVIIKSPAAGALDSIGALLQMEDENNMRPLFILWDIVKKLTGPTFLCHVNMVTGRDFATDALNCMEMLLLESSGRSGPSCRREEEDSSFRVRQCQEALFSRPYSVLRSCIELGEEIVPSEFLSYWIKRHPNILSVVDENDRLPLHLTAATAAASSLPSCSFLHILADAYPKAVSTPDQDGRLPIHLAIQAGAEGCVIRTLLSKKKSTLRSVDPQTSMFLFQFAATAASPSQSQSQSQGDEKRERDGELDLIYSLLRAAPDLSYQYNYHCHHQSRPRHQTLKRSRGRKRPPLESTKGDHHKSSMDDLIFIQNQGCWQKRPRLGTFD